MKHIHIWICKKKNDIIIQEFDYNLDFYTNVQKLGSERFFWKK